MSPIGSLTAIAPSLPARLYKAGNQALRPELAQRDTAHAMLAVVSARAATQLTAVPDARLGELRGSAASFGDAAKRSSIGRLLSYAVAFNLARRVAGWFASLRRRLFFSIE